jgi:hypothetical protein
MAHNVAHIKNGVVENVTVWSTLPTQTGIDNQGLEYVTIEDAPVGIGWEYSEGTFSNADFNYVWSTTEGRIDLVQPEEEDNGPEPLAE